MVGAKDILVKITGNNKQFKSQMAGASGSMTGFAGTTVGSTATAAGATKAMSISMAASLAVATAGITVVIAGVVALAGALKAAVTGAADDAAVTAQTTALLEQQGIVWESVSGKVTNHIEALQNLTGFGDTELQESFNTFIASGMSVEDALLAMDAATAIAASGEMNLSTATKSINKEFTTGTSKLKDYGIEADNFGSILDQVTGKFGDGSQRAETFEGKMGILSEAIMDELKPAVAGLIPIAMGFLDILVWGAKNVLPPLIYVFKILLIPIKGVIVGFKQIYEVALAAWAAITGDWDKAKLHYDNVIKLQNDYNNEIKETIGLKKEEADITNGEPTSGFISTPTGVPSPTGGAETITGAAFDEDAYWSNVMDLMQQGITPEEYSGRIFSTGQRPGPGLSETEKWEKILASKRDSISEGEENIVTETKIQTDTIKQSGNNVVDELKIQTSKLDNIIRLLAGSGGFSVFSGDGDNDNSGVINSPPTDPGNVISHLPYTGPGSGFSITGNNSGV